MRLEAGGSPITSVALGPAARQDPAMDHTSLMAIARLRLEAVYVRHPHLRPYDGDFAPDGWAHIIADALESIAAVEQASGFRARVSQIKEKIAGLRLYVRGGDDSAEGQRFAAQLMEIVQAAQRRAARTCEDCGQPGQLRCAPGWFRTTCEQHSRGAGVVPDSKSDSQAGE